MAWFVFLIAAVALTAVSYVLMPKPKQPKPAAAQDAENPVADAGKPLGVVQGTVLVTGPNILWFGEKAIRTYKVRA